MKIVFVTDGDNQLGMGHIYQSLVLAGALMQKLPKKSKVLFLTKSDERVKNLIAAEGFDVCGAFDDNGIFNILKKESPDRIIFDKLDVAVDLAQRIKEEMGAKLIILTNLTEANQYADVTVKADFGSGFKNIHKRDEATGRVEFLGPKFWLLRPEFYACKKNVERRMIDVKKIMLIFGGADPSNFSSAVLKELLDMDAIFTIKIVLGSAFQNHKELKSVRNGNLLTRSAVFILENVKNIAEIMSESDVVFASPGLSFFEALAVGTPVVAFHQDDCQRDWYKGFFRTFGHEDISRISSLIKTKDFVYPSDPFIRSMEIGKGKNEVIDEILSGVLSKSVNR